MVRNIGGIDKVIRYIIGLVIIAIGIYYRSWWGLLGLIPILTAIFSFCGLYTLLGISTTHKPTQPTDKPGPAA